MKRASRYFLFWPLILCALSFSYAFASQPDVSLTSFLELSGITDGDDNCYATDTFIQAPTSTEDKIIATDVVESYEEISNDSTGEKFQLEVSPFFRTKGCALFATLLSHKAAKQLLIYDRLSAINFQDPFILYQSFRV